MKSKKGPSDTSIYYLALNKGYAKNDNCSDQFIFADLTNINGKKGFRSLPKATEFTSQFSNYTELFDTLLETKAFNIDDLNLDNMGNPFVLVHYINNKWQICGMNKYRSENQILFHDKAYLLDGKPKSDGNGYDLNITKNLKTYFSLPLPQTAQYDLRSEKEVASDNKKYEFLYEMVNKIKVMINDMRNLKTSNLENKIFTSETYNKQLSTYIHDYLRNDPFEYQDYNYIIENLIESLCVNIRRNKDGETFSYSIDYQRLFELALFCINYYQSRGRHYKDSNGKIFVATDFEMEKRTPEYAVVYQKLKYMKGFGDTNTPTRKK